MMPSPESAPKYPEELLNLKRWCLWRLEKDQRGRLTKVPYRPDGRKASSTAEATWSRFADVQAMLVQRPDAYKGVGYFFSAQDCICGVDLDVSLDSSGSPLPWAAPIVASFESTYQALSVSGLGLHILCRATLPAKGRNFYVPDGPMDRAGKLAQIGVCDRARFFALTGQVYRGAACRITAHQPAIDGLLEMMKPRSPQTREAKQPTYSGLESDAEILERARKAANGPKFRRLWSGKWEGDYPSQSEADLALCCMLAFWCGRDAERIEALFGQSGLARDKWTQSRDYRERTIGAAFERSTEFYRGVSPASRTAITTGATQGMTHDLDRRDLQQMTNAARLPEILVGDRQLADMTRDALTALQDGNDPPQVFVRGGRLTAVERDELNRCVIVELRESALRGRLARSGSYYKLSGKRARTDCVPPLDVVRDILALPSTDWCFPPLESLVEAPFLRRDGTLCDTTGYDPATRMFYAPAAGLTVPEIPEVVTSHDVEHALDFIDSAIGDFPFADKASKANCIAALMTAVVRSTIEGPTPLAIIDAPQAGTGKSLLAEVVGIVATGRSTENFSAPKDGEEWRKKITTALVAGSSLVVVDNVNGRLDSDALCIALTSRTIADRIFGTFNKISLPVRCSWLATGNNVQVGGDMPRRCYWIRLNAKHSQPFRRTGFRHENLCQWVRTNRGELIAALLTIAQYWFQQGQPKPKSVKPLGSFEEWCISIGGMLELANVEGFLANSDLMFEQVDSDARRWEGFLLVLHEVFGDRPFRTAEVVEELRRVDPEGKHDTNPLFEASRDLALEAEHPNKQLHARRLGSLFAERVDTRCGESGVFLASAGRDSKTKVQLWKVRKP